ncbi:MAG TPA: hypothetical protein GX531_01945 [Methanothermobacter sp.]|nr:hypothetical protein [Methanothermobacter sp.]
MAEILANPTVSAVISTYNRAHLVGRAKGLNRYGFAGFALVYGNKSIENIFREEVGDK